MFENILNIENIFNSKMSIRRAFGLLGFWGFRGHSWRGFIVISPKKIFDSMTIEEEIFPVNYLLRIANLNIPCFSGEEKS
jgi:hypothetical protein